MCLHRAVKNTNSNWQHACCLNQSAALHSNQSWWVHSLLCVSVKVTKARLKHTKKVYLQKKKKKTWWECALQWDCSSVELGGAVRPDSPFLRAEGKLNLRTRQRLWEKRFRDSTRRCWWEGSDWMKEGMSSEKRTQGGGWYSTLQLYLEKQHCWQKCCTLTKEQRETKASETQNHQAQPGINCTAAIWMTRDTSME